MLKQLRARWDDPAFLAVSLPLVRKLINERNLVGPADLRGLIMGDAGAVDELLSVNLFHTKICNVDLAYATVTGSLAESEFDTVVFDHARLVHVRLNKSLIGSCSFDAARLQVNANDAKFVCCTFRGAVFLGQRSLQEWGGRRTRFDACDFSGAKFRGMEFRASFFTDCRFDDCTFTKCDLRGTKFIGSSPQLVDCIA